VFNVKWQEISAVLVSLGLVQAEVDRVDAECWRREVYCDARNNWTGSVALTWPLLHLHPWPAL